MIIFYIISPSPTIPAWMYFLGLLEVWLEWNIPGIVAEWRENRKIKRAHAEYLAQHGGQLK